MTDLLFKMKIDDVFPLIKGGVVVVGVIEKGTIYADSKVKITNEEGVEVLGADLLGLEMARRKLMSASSPNPIAIGLRDVKKEDIQAGYYVVIE
jgi:GTPases - translation elongation factors